MDVLIWINTLILIFASVSHGVILYAALREVRKSSESLSRVERVSLATLERLTTQQGSPA